MKHEAKIERYVVARLTKAAEDRHKTFLAENEDQIRRQVSDEVGAAFLAQQTSKYRARIKREVRGERSRTACDHWHTATLQI